jgi:hypothetical protein
MIGSLTNASKRPREKVQVIAEYGRLNACDTLLGVTPDAMSAD